MSQDYTVGTWHGLENYRCSHCAFATTDRRVIEDHILKEHRQITARDSGLVDSRGNPIYVEVENGKNSTD